MKLRTSFFNGTVLKKDITRFAPLWGVYSVFLLLYLLGLSADQRPSQFAWVISYLFPGMAVVNGIYAGVCALFLFGDLFSSRLCNALHAMPLRREGWFLTHWVAGLLFCLVPNMVVACLACLWLGSYSYMAFIWLAVTVLQFLFFFGVGTFSAVCAGNRLGMAAIYGMINFLSMLVYVIMNSLFMPALFGLRLESDLFDLLCPLAFLCQAEYVNISYDYDALTMIWQGFVGEVWLYLGIAAALGLIFTVLAVLVYRKRKLEYAADFLALKPLSPVFLVIYTLGIGAICYELGKEVGLDLLFLVAGLAIGYFTGKMFLERKVNVFKPKAFLGFGIFSVVLALLIGLTWLDPMGITRYVPENTEIECVYLDEGSYYSTLWLNGNSNMLSDTQDVAQIADIHKALVSKKQTQGDLNITLIYKLKDGRTVSRYYPVVVESAEGQALKPYFSRWEYVFGTDDWAGFVDRVQAAMINFYTDNRTLAVGASWFLEDHKYSSDMSFLELKDGNVIPLLDLLAALRKDCAAGNMAQPWAYYFGNNEDVGWVELHLANNDVRSIRVTTDSVYTLALLEDLFKQAATPEA